MGGGNGGGIGGRTACAGVEPQRRPLDPAVAPAAGAEAVVVGAGLVSVPAAATPGAGPRGRPPAPAVVQPRFRASTAAIFFKRP